MSFFNAKVDVIAFAAQIDLDEVKTQFEKLFIVQKYRDSMHIELPKGHFFVFDYGVLVAWGVNPAKQVQYLELLKGLAIGLQAEQIDQYEFKKLASESNQLLVVDNQLTLPNVHVDSLLALSHAFAQSAKLQHFEALAELTLSKNQYLIKTLSEAGEIPLRRKALAKLRGQLFQTKSDIVMHYNLLDTAAFFGNASAVEHLYSALAKYLELKSRVDLLNLKLQTIHDLYDMLAAEQNHKHCSFLAWLIIALIALEVIQLFVH
jgi:uncharacterized Rmd1/YagE family protein